MGQGDFKIELEDIQSNKPHPVFEELNKLTLKEDVKLRAAFIDDFLEANTERLKWEKVEAALKDKVRDFLRDSPLLEDIYLGKAKGKPKYDPVRLYDFIAGLPLPQGMLEDMTIKTIDESKLDQLFVQQYIEVADLEPYYKEGGETERIEIKRKRKKKDDEVDS